MAINFPSNPSNGDTHAGFTYNSTVGAWESTASNPVTQATLDGYLQVANSSSGTTVYSAISDLPLSGNESGAQAYVSGTNRLYLWTGTGWYNIALINTNPSLSGASATYSLNTDGSNTVVTLASTDPEGLPISFTVSHSGIGVGANAIATVTQSNNIFTFTPTTNTALAGTFTTTFTASDGVNVAVANSSFTLAFIVNIQDSNYTTALITSVGANNADNNDFVDSSTNSHTITAYSNATQSTFSPYRQGGYSTYFDGVGDYIRYQDASLAEGTDDFTVEFWVKRDGTQSLNDTIVGHDTTPGWQICFNSDGSTIRFMKDATDASRVLPASLNNQQWHHVVYQRDSGTLQGFLDGVSLGTSGTSTNFTNDKIEIGVNRGGTAYFKGDVRDVRIIKGTAFYSSSGFDVPTEPLTAVSGTGYSTTLLTCHLPYIADGGANSLSPTVNGNTSTRPFAPYDYETYSASVNAGSLRCEGTNRLTMPDSADFDFGSGDFTIECWFMDTNGTRTNTQNGLFNQSAPGATSDSAFFFGAGNNGLSMYLSTSGSSWTHNATTSVAPQVNTWAHIVWQRSGNTLQMYLNGVLQTVTAGSSSFTGTIFNSSRVVEVASQNNISWVVGLISDLRVVKGTAVYSSNFTPPTAPLTAITNTKLLLPFDDAGIIDKSQSVQTLTLYGDAKSSTTQTKYLSSSVYLDGTGDYLDIVNDEGFNFSTSDFTIEFWMYPSAIGSENIILESRAGHTDSGFLIMLNGSVIKNLTSGSVRTTGGTTITTGSWYHVAVVRDSTSLRTYLNGTEESGSASYTASITNPFSKFRLGARFDGASPFNGYFSDVRITKGLARYTANFTPPTAALQG